MVAYQTKLTVYLYVSTAATLSVLTTPEAHCNPGTYQPITLEENQPRVEPAPDTTQLDKIQVTGSRIRRTSIETEHPVLSITRDMIERSGATSLGELIQDLPVAGSAMNTAFNNGGEGAIEVNLRNLGSSRVLLLVNGRRWVNGVRTLATSAADLTTIPVSIVERIDVLKDGASTTYGSDAVSGVINIITRTQFDGVELRAQYGAFEQGDGRREGLTATWGGMFGKTSVFLDVNYANDQEVFAGDRAISNIPVQGTGLTRGSLATPQGTFIFVPDPTATNTNLLINECDRVDVLNDVIESESGIDLPIEIPAALGQIPVCQLILRDGFSGENQTDFRRFDPVNDPYNYAPINYLLTPNERTSLFAQIQHPLPYDLSLSAELLLNRRASQQVLAEWPLFIGDALAPPASTIYVAADQQFNPFGQDIGRKDPVADFFGNGAILRRLSEQGVRDFRQSVDTQRIALGLSGDFAFNSRSIEWDINATLGNSRNKATNVGLVDLHHVRLALGPATDCDADPDCVPLNLFGGQGDGSGSITQDMLGYITYVDRSSQNQQLQNYLMNARTDLTDLAAGPLGLAFGLEFRKEDYRSIPDPFVQSGRSSNAQQSITDGSIQASELFVELAVPILAQTKWTESLDLSIAGRYSDYGRLGSKTVGKLGLRWQPSKQLLIRSTASEAFRAPAISDLFLGRAQSYPLVSDPCNEDSQAEDSNTQQNCEADGVPANYSQTLLQLPSEFGGNPRLHPENANTVTAGLVFSPSAIAGFNLSLDWYRIEIHDFITAPGAQYIMDACYRVEPEMRRLCSNIERDTDTGVVSNILNQYENFATVETSGIDFSISYKLPQKSFGRLSFHWDSSYLINFTQHVPTADGNSVSESLAGRYEGSVFANFPRFRSNTELAWNAGNVRASWHVRYIHGVIEHCEDGFVPSLIELDLCSEPTTSLGPQNRLPSAWYHDIQLGYILQELDLDVSIGIDNLFDQKPPVGYTSFTHSFDVTTYRVPGVFSYIRLVKRF
ncbi:MAG: TonB-dependent receptor plug domain-containing protein [Oceanococcus sp.]